MLCSIIRTDAVAFDGSHVRDTEQSPGEGLIDTAIPPRNRPTELREQAIRAGAVLLGAVLLLWPAMLNGYVLLNPDSTGYLAYGRMIADALQSRTHWPFEARAEFYCLAIHWIGGDLHPWRVIALQALLLSYVIWLVVRSLAKPAAPVFLTIIAVLSLCTGLSWQVSWVMTDILGSCAYLCLYLLLLAWKDLTVPERWLVGVIGWWCITAHLTHLLLAGAALVMFVAVWAMLRRLRPVFAPVAAATAMLLVSFGSLAAMHAYLYGTPSVQGYHPPYLMARVIADGPGRVWLEQHCPAAGLVICKSADHLPTNSNDILWLPDSFWLQADAAERTAIRQQEMPFVLAVIRQYPLQESRRAFGNFIAQARAFGFRVFINSPWMEAAMDGVLPGSRAAYDRSRQAHDAMPTRAAGRVQLLLLAASCCLLMTLGVRAIRLRHMRLIGLAVIALPVVVENAFLCGVLSNVDDRLQNRVIWLVPLLALLLLADFMRARQSQQHA